MLSRLLILLAAPLLLTTGVAARETRPAPVFTKGMVSAADPRAAAAGAEILRAGGSAADAAIATMLALNVVEPQSSGIGGGGFYVSSDPAGRVETIDGRETAPAAATPQWFTANGKVLTFSQAVPGGTSVGIPGNLALAAKAHAAHGRLPWARLFVPAIRLAERGFTVTPRLNAALTNARDSAAFAAGQRVFYTAAGDPLPVGARLRLPVLAKTLRDIARRGPDAFYTGANAAAMVGAVTTAPHNPAPMTSSDLTAYRAKDRPPVCGAYRGYRICGMGPPSSGATTVFATLKQLERFDLHALGKDSPVAWHLIAESLRVAYADRGRWLADSDFITVPLAGLTDPAYLAQRSQLIDPARTNALVTAGIPPGAAMLSRADPAAQPENGTSHFVVVDRSGAAVSYTSTIESAFGSGLYVGGYYLNNELTDFDFAPEQGGRLVANRVEGGKRPRSSMSPTVVFAPDGKLRLVIGAAGGATIPAQVAKAIIGVIDWQLSAQSAIALPVLFVQGETVIVERGSALEAMVPALQALGHTQVTARAMPLKANAIEVVAGHLIGAADPRSEGRMVTE
ncbi:MAG: gamma-glutamyltransferase 1, Threonine peptidase family [Novosphingobium sp.]|nr:gamma-glutamyltransferase 1, Threonine peptidase family [Novosphingobium sp.]